MDKIAAGKLNVADEGPPDRPRRRDEEKLDEYGSRLRALSPEPVNNFVPSDAGAQREAFLAGEIVNPSHDYCLLDVIDFNEKLRALAELQHDLEANNQLQPLQKTTLLGGIAYTRHVFEYMRFVHDYNHASSDEDRVATRRLAQEKGDEVWGGVDTQTYRGLLYEEFENLEANQYTPEGYALAEELKSMVPMGEKIERFVPSPETVKRLQGALEALYGNLFEQIPTNQDTFNAEDIRAIFDGILRSQFGAAAASWGVELAEINSINVSPTEKLIRIPCERSPISRNQLKGLVAHEIGVHMMRALSGADTDVPALETGLPNYYDSEEGTGKVFQQAIEGKFSDSGIPYYLVAGLLDVDGKDFRGAFEFMWRLNVLKKAKKEAAITEDMIDAQKQAAYKTVMRIARGSDGGVAWTKDLAYYNGSMNAWQYFEDKGVDELTLMGAVLLGKGDPTIANHRRVMLDSRSKG